MNRILHSSQIAFLSEQHARGRRNDEASLWRLHTRLVSADASVGHDIVDVSYASPASSVRQQAVSLPCVRESAYGSRQSVLLGWSVSTVVHGVVLAVVVICRIQTISQPAVPQKEPFRWDVSLMAAPQNELLVADGVQPQEAAAVTEPDHLPPTGDARPSQAASTYPDHSEETILQEVVAPELVPDSGTYRPPALSAPQAVPVERSARPTMIAVANPVASVLPPPEVEISRDSDSLQVETQRENPTVLQRPQSVTRPLVIRTALPDYAWLMDALRAKLEGVKVYPRSARSVYAQGRVVVLISVQGDGRIVNPEIEESSGYPILDQAALDALRAASPLKLDHLLEGAPVVMSVPLNYQLE